jgi:hypothetical protein
MTGFDFISYQNIGKYRKRVSQTLKPTSSYLNTHKQRTLPGFGMLLGIAYASNE